MITIKDLELEFRGDTGHEAVTNMNMFNEWCIEKLLEYKNKEYDNKESTISKG